MAYATPRVAKQHDHVINAKDAKQSSERNMQGWKCELDDKIWTVMMPVKEYLSKVVPCNEELPDLQAIHPFDVPTGGREIDMYEPMLAGLTKLVENFTPAKRPTFYNNAHEEIKFPFLLGEQTHHATKPDIVASLPGLPMSHKFPDRWRNISVVFEAKSTEDGDPMKHSSKTHDETLVQLSKSARNILVAQSRLFAFAVGIYGSQARIFRFDHAGAVCSQPFEYAADNGAILYEFLWRLVHPIPEGCDIVGADPTVRLVTSTADQQKATQQLHDAGIPDIPTEMRKACRYFVVKGDSEPDKTYLAYELLFMNPRLFSRASTIWKAVELDPEGNPTATHVVIKDAWRQLARTSEAEHYAKIYDYYMSNTPGEPSVRGAGSTQHRFPSDEEMQEALGEEWLGIALCTLANDLGEDELREGTFVGHQTASGVFHACGHHRWYERSHMRLVSHSVGTPLSQFRSTKEMVTALRDAIRGHRLAFEAGIIHRDISEGNIMIYNGKGFLHDLDYGFDWKAFLWDLGYEDTIESWEKFVATEEGIPPSQQEDAQAAQAKSKTKTMMECKQRTGTYIFMSVEVLRARIIHQVRHDLEACFWLLLWIVLRHTDHRDPEEAYNLLRHLFYQQSESTCAASKRGFFGRGFDVYQNQPLSRLVKKFSQLCAGNSTIDPKDKEEKPSAPLTYESVLALFEEALASNDWPVDDKAIPFVP
ncbi:hypothetical protein C8Q72DRAFT_777872, partial [Fomitopsis betulina]